MDGSHEETLDPGDWSAARAVAHRAVDDASASGTLTRGGSAANPVALTVARNAKGRRHLHGLRLPVPRACASRPAAAANRRRAAARRSRA
jgi:glutamate/tyrosine decarboxylase-like PLP-dependent enzyme